MLQLFRFWMAILIRFAPLGTVGCNYDLPQATVCWIEFSNPTYVEYLSPLRITRLRAIVEMAKAGQIAPDQ